MNGYQPGGWVRRLIAMVALLVGLAVVARVIYELLAPLIPGLLALLLLGAALSLIVRGRPS